jgi:sugar lactone lactonase YvrE
MFSSWHDADFEYGPVTAVDISETAESVWLACGHERGHVVIWDALSGRRYGDTRLSASRSENPQLVTDGRSQLWVVVHSVKTLDDIHASAIVSLRFINDKGRLISIDLAVRHLLFQKQSHEIAACLVR